MTTTWRELGYLTPELVVLLGAAAARQAERHRLFLADAGAEAGGGRLAADAQQEALDFILL